ncbi:intradiol ring-cleavage dioxygenase [Streptomyces sp. NPDC014986]|uniref:intradiol ring-cleavage dioxygenase n=1 Tax=Streptomyces sp. NPDC014986 TaxID=3364934 RepID=UPI00370241DB
MTQDGAARHKRNTSRRQVLIAGGAAVAVAGTGAVLASNALADDPSAGATGAKAAAGETCYRLNSEAIEGPYYIDADKIRADVTEDKVGVPLTLTVKVIDSVTCKPVRNAAVDIWHCDALGIYSGYEAQGSALPPGMSPDSPPPAGSMHLEPTDSERYLRGTLRTDHAGKVRFTSIFPGWYEGRAAHIHTKVHVDGKWTKDGYEGGRTCHTGQFYFEEEAVLAVAGTEPYSTSTVDRVTLPEDTVYDDSGATGGLLTLRYDKKRIMKGVSASITVGVDPEATSNGDVALPSTSASPSA